MTRPSHPGLARRWLRFAVGLLVTAAAVAALLAVVGRAPAARYTRYDALLGWSHQPGLTVPDMYGPGRTLTISAQGFRHAGEVAADPAPRRRVICVGDSFTLGNGVGDADTWCARLAAGDTTLETVNMGQSGYGLDQAFLWYRRDAAPLRQDLVIVAYIANDFDRMRVARFDGYPKPTLRLVHGRLDAANVPVPPASGIRFRLERAIFALERTRVMEVTNQGAQRLAEHAAPEHDPLDTLVSALVAALDSLARARGGRLMLVQLPTYRDYESHDADHWRRSIPAAARDAGVTWVDLVAALRELPRDSMAALFIPRDGHYTVAGNAWVAERLRAQLAQALRTTRGGHGGGVRQTPGSAGRH